MRRTARLVKPLVGCPSLCLDLVLESGKQLRCESASSARTKLDWAPVIVRMLKFITG
jgi:hypothetical protein